MQLEITMEITSIVFLKLDTSCCLAIIHQSQTVEIVGRCVTILFIIFCNGLVGTASFHIHGNGEFLENSAGLHCMSNTLHNTHMHSIQAKTGEPMETYIDKYTH